MTCHNTADEQFVSISLTSGLHELSPPLCEDCSNETQPAETIDVLGLIDTDHVCNCEGCEACYNMGREDE